MKKSFTLSIQTPCSEKFDQFSPTSSGGFCQSCQKEVVDFTGMSEGEIQQYIKANGKLSCGRFHASQLKTYTPQPTTPQKSWRHAWGAGIMAFSLFAAFPFLSAKAQTPTLALIDQERNAEEDATEGGIPTPKLKVVKGIVRTESGEPLEGTVVLVKGTNVGMFTDNKGRFALKYDFQPGDILVFQFIGYETQEYELKKSDLREDEMDMQLDLRQDLGISMEEIWMGDVAVNEVYQSRPTFWQRVKNVFR